MAAARGMPEAQARMAFDPRLRARHLQRARIHDWTGPDPVRVRDPTEILRGPEAPVRFSPDHDVYCDFLPRDNHGGNPKFRCFMMTGHRSRGGRYYDESGNVQSAAEAVLFLDRAAGSLPVLAGRNGDGALQPLTAREGFRKRFVRPLELKVKYRSLDSPDLLLERDMNSEVAGTRLLWALHYPADRMYRVRRVHCHRCPRDPFNDFVPETEGQYTTFDEAAVELRYEAGQAEECQSWHRGGWSWGEELHRLRYGTGPDSFSEEQKKHFDGLVLLSSLVQHASKRPDQNRLVCLRGAIQQFGGAFKVCPDTVLMVNDIGSVFGKRQQESLEYWRAWRVWKNADTCEAALPRMTRDECRIRNYLIGQAGQHFILGLLDQLTDEHLRALLEAADFARFDFTLVPPGSPLSPDREEEIIESWIAAFREKVEQVRAVDCTGP
jgi:hypothetical protein